ncbi:MULTISPECIES: DNA/RNA non-specific endonuclease [Exiguobacterium]|uniref:DNA/RNA non-specific endonuclease n=1 Tax=Exiguobacterium TaxID=33986 RepID=UPI0020373538|nr:MULTISPECIES: DNA/RNA non-specific endonuclease [Exiguobacterium]MCT4783110.1 DNA/RNA non-specific endonuclease [Exiguobacterium himgiriensis]
MKFTYSAFPLAILLMAGCTSENTPSTNEKAEEPATQTEEVVETTETSTDDSNTETTAEEPATAEETVTNSDNNQFSGYKLINVDGGDLSGYREANVVVDIGYGDREYWAFTNEHGQLIRVIADQIILQDDDTEDVTSDGRYYHDEAKVPGVEHSDLDEGHVIADSLGGVSNAYNITPQDSTLNRYGDQAYMEDVIRKAGGATDFEANITYPDTTTHIPSHYEYTYTVRGNVVTDSFDNVNPDEVNEALGLTESEPEPAAAPETTGDVSSVDTNGNGQVTIQEAKDAGFTMPIMSDHWLYPYMRDNDNDGMVGE